MARKVQFVHKLDRTLYITVADQHWCQAACVKTFASGSVWNLFNYKKIPDQFGFEVDYDEERCFNDYLTMRAYKEQDSGVLILENRLWDDNRKSFNDELSVFAALAGDLPKLATKQEDFDFIVKKSFSIRGYDDLGRIAHNMITIPRGTQFTWVRDGLDLYDPHDGRTRRLPPWHMTSLRNAQIGIEVDLPTRYLSLVLKPIDATVELPKDTEPYSDRTYCRCCKTNIAMPNGAARGRSWRSCAYGIGSDGTEYKIEDWLCDVCYEDIFEGRQHAWAFQVGKDSFIPRY